MTYFTVIIDYILNIFNRQLEILCSTFVNKAEMRIGPCR